MGEDLETPSKNVIMPNKLTTFIELKPELREIFNLRLQHPTYLEKEWKSLKNFPGFLL